MAEEGKLVPVESLRKILKDTLPQDEIVHAFGYGSGVLSQGSSSSIIEKDDSKMIDMIVVVRDSYKFHKANLELNRNHYSVPWLVSDAASFATWWQRHSVDSFLLRNPKVYFNVTDHIKYGVVQVEDLMQDLVDWKYLYLAGRMHKPTVTLVDRQYDDEASSIAQQQEQHNLPAALSASLLLLSPEGHDHIPATSIYTQIASLSYVGDFRMKTGAEDPQKIHKLVQSPGQLHRFEQLYSNAANGLQTQGMLSISGDREWSWDVTSTAARDILWKTLPLSLQQLYDSSMPQDSVKALQATLPSIVAPATRYQSFKGLVTAGPRKSFVYALRKLSKGLLRKS